MRRKLFLNRAGCVIFILVILAISAVGIYAILNMISERGTLVGMGTNVESMLTKRVKGGAKVLQTVDIGEGIGSCRVALYMPNKAESAAECGYGLFEEQGDKRYRYEKSITAGDMTVYAPDIRVSTFSFRKVEYLVVIATGDDLPRVEVISGANTQTQTVAKSPGIVMLELPANSIYRIYDSGGNIIEPPPEA